MEEIFTYDFNGYTATVIRPEKPNGKWIWKTEFLYAFDKAERELLSKGYTRVYYAVSNMYGDYKSVRLMHAFYLDVVKKFDLSEKCCLFGFSRGGLYAFNYALFYPDTVEKIYLDAPVLDLTTWPSKNGGEETRKCYYQMLECYNFDDDTLATFDDSPIHNLKEFFDLKIPLLIVAGGSDEVVDYNKNSAKVIAYCKDNKIPLKYYVKPECKHHPHSLEDVTPIINFICGE